MILFIYTERKLWRTVINHVLKAHSALKKRYFKEVCVLYYCLSNHSKPFGVALFRSFFPSTFSATITPINTNRPSTIYLHQLFNIRLAIYCHFVVELPNAFSK